MTITQQPSINDQTISAGLGEIQISSDSAKFLACFGLGSCICVCAYDPLVKVAGMAHIVLPESKSTEKDMTATKYADIAIPVLLEGMTSNGASMSKLVVKLAGGAQMIQAAGFTNVLDMGNRNLESTRNLLKARSIQINAEDVGGSQGRSIWLSVATGEVMVSTAGKEFKPL